MAPDGAGPIRITVEGNDVSGSMPPDAAGIVATLFALCRLANITSHDDIIDRYYDLRSFAIEHTEAAVIFAAID